VSGQNRSGHYRVIPGSSPLYRLDLFNGFSFVLRNVIDYRNGEDIQNENESPDMGRREYEKSLRRDI
jgi:hypothetical protein